MASPVFYTVLVESTVNRHDSFVQVFWTWAQSRGEAIDRVVTVAREYEEIPDPLPTEMDPYDIETLPEEVKEIESTGVYTTGGRYYYPTGDLAKQRRTPAGIILSCLDGQYEADELHVGYSCAETEDGLFKLTALPPGGLLEETFLEMVEALPSIRVSWLEISNEWEDTQTKQLYANEALNTPEKIRAFLQREKLNIIENGWVKFTAYCSDGQTNLLIDDHKEISVLSYDESIRNMLADVLEQSGVPESQDLRTLTIGYHHWHYLPEGALDRETFIAHLVDKGFFLWREIDVPDEKEIDE